MNSKLLLLASSSILFLTACKKEEIKDNTPKTYADLQIRAAHDFGVNIGEKLYVELNNSAIKLADAAESFYIDGSAYNLSQLRLAWQKTYTLWSLSESVQFGPVKEGSFNDKIASTSVRPSDIENILASGNNLETNDIEALGNNLKGLHVVEYLLYGPYSNKTLNQFHWREGLYMKNACKLIAQNTNSIRSSWVDGYENFATSIIYTGRGSQKYSKYNALFKEIAIGMNDLCGNIISSKLNPAYDAIDSTVVNAPFANLSLEGIKSNIQSIKSAYTSKYNDTNCYGLSDIVSDKNTTLNSKINDRFSAIESALSNINVSLDIAVYTQRDKVKTLIDAVTSLHTTINDELIPFTDEKITN